MALIIDSASTSRRLTPEAVQRWAGSSSAFISSEMSQLREERAAVAARLRELGMTVVMFEELGGRDEDAVTAYFDGVARADVYIGIVGDRYGRMQDSGRSATHEEYRLARELGKRISIWVAEDGADRQGNARDFIQEVETFHTTGRFSDADDLAARVVERVAEMAADDEAPWVMAGDAVFRASVIRDVGPRIEIEADVRDPRVAHYLESLRADQWSRSSSVRITTSDRSGVAEIDAVISEARSLSSRIMRIDARITWEDGSADSMAAGTSGYSADDLAEIGLKAGLLGDPVPENLRSYEFMIDVADPLAGLLGNHLPEASIQPIARLLVVDRLVGGRQAGRVDEFSIGPEHDGRRRVSLTYTETRRYSNVEPGQRRIEGSRTT